MLAFEDLQKIANNPQALDTLAGSAVDPNAVMAYQMGGTMPEVPGVHMGTQNPSVPQGPVPAGAPAGNSMALLAGGAQLLGRQQQPSLPMSPAPKVGTSAQVRVPNYSTPVRPTRAQGIDELLASFRK